MAYPVTLNGRTYTLADFEGTNYVEGLPDAFQDFVTHAGDIYNSTSTTSNSIGTGSKTFTVESAKPYQAGTPLRIADAAAPSTNFIDAIVTSYSGTTLVVDSVGYAGSGTFTSWNVNIGGSASVAGTVAIAQGGTGATTAAAARTNLDVYSKADADSRFLNVSGEASDVTMTGNVTIGDAGTDTLTINAATTTTADISFGDNDKAIFGAGSDLQIYHDGSHSYISDQGTGRLKIFATDLEINNAGNTANYIQAFDGGAVQLFYNNSQKLATTNTGVDITGTLTSDGLTVDGTFNFTSAVNGIINNPASFFINIDSDNNNAGEAFYISRDAENTAGARVAKFDATGDISFYEDTGTTAKFFWDASAESLGIGTSSPSDKLTLDSGQMRLSDNYGIRWGTASTAIYGSAGAGTLQMYTNSSERMRLNSDGSVHWKPNGTTQAMTLDASGNLLVGKTSTAFGSVGARLSSTDNHFTTNGGAVADFNRLTSDGAIVNFYKDGTTVASIVTQSGNIILASGSVGVGVGGDNLYPTNGSGASTDNVMDVGDASARFDDVYATNGTIQTSDQNEKQQIASLTDAEMTAAKAISKLFKTFKWNNSVAEKGDAARTHTGVVAQEVEQAMTDAGLNAGDYAFFISTTWWETQTEVPAVEADEENGVEAQEAYTRTDTYDTLEEAPEGATERNRKGIRYPQLMSFIGAATEQRLASIEARLDALEGA